MDILIWDREIRILEQEGCSLPLNAERNIDPHAWRFRVSLGYAHEHNLNFYLNVHGWLPDLRWLATTHTAKSYKSGYAIAGHAMLLHRGETSGDAPGTLATPACGCKIEAFDPGNYKDLPWLILHCPLHAAAEDLLDAVESLIKVSFTRGREKSQGPRKCSGCYCSSPPQKTRGL